MTSMAKRRIKTVLVDLSGTIHIEDEEISGSKDTLKMYAFSGRISINYNVRISLSNC